MKQLLITLILFFTLGPAPVFAGGLEVTFTSSGKEGAIRQGDVVLVTVESSEELSELTGKFKGRTIYFKSTDGVKFNTLIGMDVDEKVASYELALFGKSGRGVMETTRSFDVQAREYKVEKLTLPEKMVTYDAVTLKRVKREGESLTKLKNSLSEERWWEGGFILPAEGKVSYNFGARRILNGIKKKPHSGVDIKAYKGTPVTSPNRGKVSLVDNHYFGGKVVVVDHGHGLSTLYMHLSRILVNHGEEVEKGELIGRVGSTGRSTGPHLHWSAYLNGARIDPTGLLALPLDSLTENDSSPASADGDTGRPDKESVARHAGESERGI